MQARPPSKYHLKDLYTVSEARPKVARGSAASEPRREIPNAVRDLQPLHAEYELKGEHLVTNQWRQGEIQPATQAESSAAQTES